MRSADDEDDESNVASMADEGRPAWMTGLASHAADWLKLLPLNLPSPPSDSSPLARFFAREASIGQKLLKRIRSDLKDLLQICEGQIKQTNELRSLMSDLNKGEPLQFMAVTCAELGRLGSIPSHWKKFKTPKGLAVAQFISNLASRLSEFEAIASKPDVKRGIWLGGLFQPEAYITATRQTVAHHKGCSLEQLVLHLDLEDVHNAEGVTIEGELVPLLPLDTHDSLVI